MIRHSVCVCVCVCVCLSVFGNMAVITGTRNEALVRHIKHYTYHRRHHHHHHHHFCGHNIYGVSDTLSHQWLTICRIILEAQQTALILYHAFLF